MTPSPIICALDTGYKKATVESEDGSQERAPQNYAIKSDAMRRILGLDGTGLLRAVQRTRTISDVGSVFKLTPATPNNKLPGLGNWDHSCYQNSVIQGLASLRSFREFLNQDISSEGTSVATRNALKDITTKLNEPVNMGKTFWIPVALKSMSSWQQQDAQEYFSKVLDELEKDTAKEAKKVSSNSGLRAVCTMVPNRETSSDQKPRGGTETKNSIAPTEPSSMGQLPAELASMISRNPLEGLLAQRVGCQRCGFVEGLSLVPFNCLTVPLGRQWMQDVRTCLDDYTALEPINGVECARCTLLNAKQQMERLLRQRQYQDIGEGQDEATIPRGSNRLQDSLMSRLSMVNQALDDGEYGEKVFKECQISPKGRISTTKSRQAVVARAPRSLVIHINRSIFDELTGEQSKNNATVRFPPKLDLSPWCLGSRSDPDESRDVTESWNVNPCQSMLSGTDFEDENFDSEGVYELKAVITHYGRHENGHYICYRRSPYPVQSDKNAEDQGSDRPWWCLSDEDVTVESEKTVLAQGNVFMLLYEQQDVPRQHPAPTDSSSAEPSAVDSIQEPLQSRDAPPSEPLEMGDQAGTSTALDRDIPAAVSAPSRPTTPLPAPVQLPSPLNTPTNPTVIVSVETSTPPTPPAVPTTPIALIPPHAPSPPPSDFTSPPVVSALPAEETSSSLSPPDQDTNQASPSLPIIFQKSRVASTSPDQSADQAPASLSTASQTVSPRSGRSNTSRAGRAMQPVAGFVQSN